MAAGEKRREKHVPERRRDNRVNVDLPFVLRDGRRVEWHGTTIDMSATGILMRIAEPAPEAGAVLHVAVQGPAESGWERINVRPARVVRIDGDVMALAYADLD